MTIEPTEKDLRELSAWFNMNPAQFEENRKWLLEFWETCVHRTLAADLWMTIRTEAHRMMTPPPSITKRCGDFL